MTVNLSDLDRGIVCGLLLSHASFGGDGRQPQITLRMHVRHEKLFRWLQAQFPEGRLYGPYHHGGRDYFQWMARGPFLRVAPVWCGCGAASATHRAQASRSR